MIKDHIMAFQDCIDNLAIAHEDVYLRIFVQILEGEEESGFGVYMPIPSKHAKLSKALRIFIQSLEGEVRKWLWSVALHLYPTHLHV